MRETLYAVVRHRGTWGIRVHGAEFFACENYQLALEIALTAADLLAHAGGANRHSSMRRDCGDEAKREPTTSGNADAPRS